MGITGRIDATSTAAILVPEGQLRIAQRFIAGNGVANQRKSWRDG